MKLAHTAKIRVFWAHEENEAEVLNGLKLLAPFDISEEKIAIKRQNALGFNDRKITVFEIQLSKEKHVNAFIDNLFGKLQDSQRQMLLRQLESRVDGDANFYVRLEKELLIKNKDLIITDGGNCYHLRIKIAAYPSTREAAVKIVRETLERTTNIKC